MKDYATLRKNLIRLFQDSRRTTVELCRPLAVEDYVIQSVVDVSPPKWHLAHTTWFYEAFILHAQLTQYQPFHPQYHYLFNSYYHGVGQPYPREQRGLLSRPTVETIFAYREYVDKYMTKHIEEISASKLSELEALIVLGVNHEQQHQELLLMDIKHNFSLDPNFPIYHLNEGITTSAATLPPMKFIKMSGGMVDVGHQGDKFCFDNELPKHQQFLEPYALASRLVTNGEFSEFIAAGGYMQPRWWLADGWECVQKQRWQAPLYWHRFDNKWYIFTLSGLKELDPNEPVSHVSYYEADAYARWKEARLPLEAEWEHFVIQNNIPPQGNFMETNVYHPRAATSKTIAQMFGDLWEWTASPYIPYPGFKPLTGVLSEYNGKFMNNQMVLRGGCCITPQTHIRASYRNFFQPDKRWQFSGIRLAKNV